MAYADINWAIGIQGRSPNHNHVLLFIATHQGNGENRDGKRIDKGCFQDRPAMAKAIGVSLRTLQRVVTDLKNDGLIAIERRYRHRGQIITANRFHGVESAEVKTPNEENENATQMAFSLDTDSQSQNAKFDESKRQQVASLEYQNSHNPPVVLTNDIPPAGGSRKKASLTKNQEETKDKIRDALAWSFSGWMIEFLIKHHWEHYGWWTVEQAVKFEADRDADCKHENPNPHTPDEAALEWVTEDESRIEDEADTTREGAERRYRRAKKQLDYGKSWDDENSDYWIWARIKSTEENADPKSYRSSSKEAVIDAEHANPGSALGFMLGLIAAHRAKKAGKKPRSNGVAPTIAPALADIVAGEVTS